MTQARSAPRDEQGGVGHPSGKRKKQLDKDLEGARGLVPSLRPARTFAADRNRARR